jgi:hypothetical protein
MAEILARLSQEIDENGGVWTRGVINCSSDPVTVKLWKGEQLVLQFNLSPGETHQILPMIGGQVTMEASLFELEPPSTLEPSFGSWSA